MLVDVESDSPVYEERRCWTPTAIRVVAIMAPALIVVVVLFFLLTAEKWPLLFLALVLMAGIVKTSPAADVVSGTAASGTARQSIGSRLPELSLPMSNWRVDIERLRTVISQLAPSVTVTVIDKA
jgi:hypothetical protein